MLKNFVFQTERTEKDALKAERKALREQLFRQEQMIKKTKLPVLVLVEGWGASGKGRLIGRMIAPIDPRSFKVISTGAPTEEDKRHPFLWRHFVDIPENGKFLFLDSGWMDETIRQKQHGELSEKEYADRLQSINSFERQLIDNGYLLVKIFLHISEKEQRKRIGTLLSDKDTAWRVSEHDKWQNKHYDACLRDYEEYLYATHTPDAPWYIIESTHKPEAEHDALKVLTGCIDRAIQNRDALRQRPIIRKDYPLNPTPLLCDIDLNKTVSDDVYEEELKRCQEKLSTLHYRLYRKKIPVILAYEGWDAAGKGGNIKRIAMALDPRGYEVIPIASPLPHELARHYLWRFWRQIPKTGHITIFDRTWYGRVMVERLEGFCSEHDWQRAYNEINEFERELTDWGAVLLKFWIHIDKDTQLARFTARQNDPDKQWKITDEDWRNREKWDVYEDAVNEMIQKTSTKTAPWHIIESNDKKYARLKTMHLMIDAIETALGDKQ